MFGERKRPGLVKAAGRNGDAGDQYNFPRLENLSPIDAALALVRDGFEVFPCLASKAPACPHGFKDATRDPAALASLWRNYGGALIGVPTGRVNGFDVLDVDQPDGVVWLETVLDELPGTLVVETRRRGRHLFFQAAGVGCSAGKIAPGVDTRGAGGFVVWWAAAGCKILCDAPVAPWPAWLLERLRSQPRIECDHGQHVVRTERQVAGLIRFVANAREGERNASLFWAACRMSEMVGPTLSAGQALALLVEAARRAGLPEYEARRTVESAFKGSRHAR